MLHNFIHFNLSTSHTVKNPDPYANLLIGIFNQIDHMRGDLLAVIEHPRDLIRHRLGNGLKNAMPDLRDKFRSCFVFQYGEYTWIFFK